MRALLVWLTAAIIFYCGPSDNWAAEPEVKFNLLTLPNVRVAAEQLQAPARIFGDRITLRTSVAQMAELYQFSYWIDRRVDADKPLSLSMPEATLGECLSRLAQACEAEVGLVENVVTIAHPSHLASMQYTAVRLHDHLSRGTPSAANATNLGARKSAQQRPLVWPALTTPTELYQAIGKSWGFRAAGELPHDLMNAGRLHPCTVATQLTLLLGGFDRCAVGRQLNDLRIAPMPRASAWQAVYSDIAQANIAAATAEFPNATLSRTGKQIAFSGASAAHLRLLHSHLPRRSSIPAARGQAADDGLAKQRYTIKQDQPQPLRSVLNALAGQLGLEVKWDGGLASVDTQKAVTLDEKEASLDDIFAHLAAQSGLSIARRGRVVEVSPRGAQPATKDGAPDQSSADQ